MSARLSTVLPARLLRRHVRRGAEDHAAPVIIAGDVIVGDMRHARATAAGTGSIAFASPKSSTFTVPSAAP